MDFREEYKKSAEIMNPTEDTMARMKKNIMEKASQPNKKSASHRRLMYAGSAAAACVVVAIAAVAILPRLNISGEMTRAYSNGAAAVTDCAAENKAGAYFDMVADEAAGDTAADVEGDLDFAADYSLNDSVWFEGAAVDAAAPQQVCEAEAVATSCLIELSADGITVLLDGEAYVLVDDGSCPPVGAAVDSMSWSAADGSEYWTDFYGADYFLLYLDGVCLGGYRAE